MAATNESLGCRDTAISTLFLLGLAAVFMVVGWTLTQQGECTGLCETAGLTLLYAGGPLSAALGVFFGGVWLAWPLDITIWVAIGFAVARFAERRSRGVLGVALVVVIVALAYGLVLSQFVEIAV
jgi:hypothetical protein